MMIRLNLLELACKLNIWYFQLMLVNATEKNFIQNLAWSQNLEFPFRDRRAGACKKTGAPNDGFLLNTLKTFFRLSRVLLHL